MHNKIVNIHMVKFNYMFQKEIGDRVAHVLLSSAGLDQLKKQIHLGQSMAVTAQPVPLTVLGKHISIWFGVKNDTFSHVAFRVKRNRFTCRF